jgi:hypothetical protein
VANKNSFENSSLELIIPSVFVCDIERVFITKDNKPSCNKNLFIGCHLEEGEKLIQTNILGFRNDEVELKSIDDYWKIKKFARI